MYDTRISFIQRLSQGDSKTWQDLDKIYKPLILNWLKQYSLPVADAEDVTQEVLMFVSQKIDGFEHNGRVGAFRKWLRVTTTNIVRNYLRKGNIQKKKVEDDIDEMLDKLQDDNSSLTKEFDLAHDRQVIAYLLQNLTHQFEAQTLKIFKLNVLEEVSAKETAQQMQVSVASVHVAKSRVLRLLRQQAGDWISLQEK